MKKIRVALIRSKMKPTWPSCVTIEENIRAALGWVDWDKREWFYSGSETAEETRSIARRLIAQRPDSIVFMSYIAGSYCELLVELCRCWPKKLRKPKLHFYVYGNFTIEPGAWMVIGNAIVGWPAHFICASKRQANLVKSFFHDRSRRCVVTRPFPVNTKRFQHDQALRELVRQKMGWEGSFVCLYVGRIIPQKNVLSMVKHWLKVSRSLPRNAKLVLCGGFDNPKLQLFEGKEKLVADYRRDFNRYLARLPKAQRKKVEYLGRMSQEKLRGVYNAADCFVSLSTYHDEDFGMAPAEALATGLPSILSAWGGYADFGLPSVECRLVPVEITPRGHVIETRVFEKHLREAARIPPCLENRRTRARAFERRYSQESGGRELDRLVRKRTPVFFGVNSKLFLMARMVTGKPWKSVYSEMSTKDRLYFLNYSHYTRQKFKVSREKQKG